MSEILEKMCAAYDRTCRHHGLSEKEAMIDALAVLSKPENISNEMCRAAYDEAPAPWTPCDAGDFQQIIAAAIASLVKG